MITKYPRTPHLEGSNLAPGDSAADRVSIREITRLFPSALWVVEEKLDGANTGLSADLETFDLVPQSRGHALRGGAREGQFSAFKEWATVHEAEILDVLEDRYVSYHEWTWAVHTKYYDALPHYLHEFDLLDRNTGRFLSTAARREALRGSPFVSVPVLYEGPAPSSIAELTSLVRPSLYQTPSWREALREASALAGVPHEVMEKATRDDDLSEGLYVKIEDGDETVARFKWVRHGFVQTILDNGQHWSERPIVRNRLADGVDIMAAPGVAPSP